MTSDEDLNRIIRAIEFATRMHSTQRRKDEAESPYINHPVALMHILWIEAEVRDVDVIVAALLHDTVEDTLATFEDLEREFGEQVTTIVREVTDDKELPKQERKRLQIEHARSASPKAQQVKLADKISNLRDLAESPPPTWSAQRRAEYFDWAKEVIDQVRGVHDGLEALFDAAYENRPETH